MTWTWPQDVCAELEATAKGLVAAGKGIAALDESTETMEKRLKTVNVENTEANRAWWRWTVMTTPNLNNWISGVILTDETLWQKNADGQTMVDWCKQQNIWVGVKADRGVVNMWGTWEEKTTTGLDGLPKRCADWWAAGVRFAKWRAVVTIDPTWNKPSEWAINEACQTLAKYALICQEHRIVPIIEPEVLSDGNWSIEQGAWWTKRVWSRMVWWLNEANVWWPGVVLKPNMVTAGNEWSERSNPEDIARWTWWALGSTIPAMVPGICFLSGGQAEETASVNLNAINKWWAQSAPWRLSFSYGRALQATALKVWSGNNANKEAVWKAIAERARANSDATQGTYKGGVGGNAATGSLYEKKYVY